MEKPSLPQGSCTDVIAGITPTLNLFTAVDQDVFAHSEFGHGKPQTCQLPAVA